MALTGTPMRGSSRGSRAIRCRQQAADAAAFDREADRAYGRRWLHVSQAFAGMVRLDGDSDPDCGRSNQWCDAHQIRHWAQGGATDLDNLVLLCRLHHRQTHAGEIDLPKRQ